MSVVPPGDTTQDFWYAHAHVFDVCNDAEKATSETHSVHRLTLGVESPC